MKTLGLFERRFDGDDCLMELARRRFVEAGMGAEMHAATPEQLEAQLRFRPGASAPVVIHLPRDFDLLNELSRQRIVALATRFAGQVGGLVLHDHLNLAARTKEYIDAAWALEQRLETIPQSPVLFIEYAAGLEPAAFASFFAAIRDLDRLSACIDIGHVGIRAARAAYAVKHPAEDVCALKSKQPVAPALMADVQAAVASGFAAVLDLLEPILGLKKPVHFHLHDGHPLSTFSPFGVSDHLSFFSEIPLSFEYEGRRALPLMFGPDGLARLVARACALARPELLSFTLEIHPTGEQLPLGDAAEIFAQWADKTNPERMNHWLSLLARNHVLLQQAMKAALPEPTPLRAPPPAPLAPNPELTNPS